jgi:hypothetical protein
MDHDTHLQLEDSPPLPVVVGDIHYLYRKDPNYDRALDEIDWENLLFDEPDEFDPNLHAYRSDNYATEEEAEVAWNKLFDECLEEAIRNAAADRRNDQTRHA